MKIKKNLDRACGAELLGTCFGILVDLTVEDERCNIIAQHPDAIAISVMAMRTYPDQKPVCTHACNLLANFCDTDDSKRVAIFEAGIIPLVNAMMMKFPDDEDVQHRGALLVNNLLRTTFRIKSLSQNGAVAGLPTEPPASTEGLPTVLG